MLNLVKFILYRFILVIYSKNKSFYFYYSFYFFYLLKNNSRKELTEFERGEIIGLWKGKHSLRDIGKILNHPKSTVYNIIDNYKKQNLTTAMPRSGRPKLLTERNTRQLTKIVKNNRNNTLDEITEELNSSLNLSVSKR